MPDQSCLLNRSHDFRVDTESSLVVGHQGPVGGQIKAGIGKVVVVAGTAGDVPGRHVASPSVLGTES